MKVKHYEWRLLQSKLPNSMSFLKSEVLTAMIMKTDLLFFKHYSINPIQET